MGMSLCFMPRIFAFAASSDTGDTLDTTTQYRMRPLGENNSEVNSLEITHPAPSPSKVQIEFVHQAKSSPPGAPAATWQILKAKVPVLQYLEVF